MRRHVTNIGFVGDTSVNIDKIFLAYTQGLKESYVPEERPKLETLSSKYGSYWTLPLQILLDSIPALPGLRKGIQRDPSDLEQSHSPPPIPVVQPIQIALKLTLMNKDNMHFDGRVREQSLLVVCFAINQHATLEAARSTWVPKIRARLYARRVPIFLLGIGSQLRDHAQGQNCVTFEDGSNAATQLGCAQYFELSTGPIGNSHIENYTIDPEVFSPIIYHAYKEAEEYNQTRSGKTHHWPACVALA
ncbi:hypothetical protein BKA70DRAFT_1562964 [Coprinopsis sp. MPI-PUGE-AT-0042]|nr:hypothetical protein BKA70DRAFT_1562964 [Coprinopsis sp. MPI-PUGE-AT-0042]